MRPQDPSLNPVTAKQNRAEWTYAVYTHSSVRFFRCCAFRFTLRVCVRVDGIQHGQSQQDAEAPHRGGGGGGWRLAAGGCEKTQPISCHHAKVRQTAFSAASNRRTNKTAPRPHDRDVRKTVPLQPPRTWLQPIRPRVASRRPTEKSTVLEKSDVRKKIQKKPKGGEKSSRDGRCQ